MNEIMKYKKMLDLKENYVFDGSSYERGATKNSIIVGFQKCKNPHFCSARMERECYQYEIEIEGYSYFFCGYKDRFHKKRK